MISHRASAGHPEIGWFDAQGINEGDDRRTRGGPSSSWATEGGPEQGETAIIAEL